ncbi:MAG: stage II sporulation protein R [Clostridia bacterium]|nr:stage II sporulation protein R [Clostridia bacterium]
MKTKHLLILCFSLCTVLLFVGLFPVHGEQEVYDTVIRLHVLANSDSEEDQALKLKVRDAVLEVTNPLLVGCSTQSEAKKILEANLQTVEDAAQSVVRAHGRSDAVSILLDLEEYPTRDYDSFCFPAGEYLSMRVCIGDAAGQNWWCCLFPPLCVGSASVSDEDAEDAFISVGFTPSQYKIITESDRPVYRARFKILEILFGR